MKDLLFFGSMAMGFAIMAFGWKTQVSRGLDMNRPAFGFSLIVGSLFWWVCNAILLSTEGKFYFSFNLLTVVAFFVGLAFLVPLPPGATRINQHRLLGHILLWTGIMLGLAHSLALTFSPEWSAALQAFHARFGLPSLTQ